MKDVGRSQSLSGVTGVIARVYIGAVFLTSATTRRDGHAEQA